MIEIIINILKHMKKTVIAMLLNLAALVSTASAAYAFGKCPAFTTMQNVDRSRFVTTWYEQMHEWSVPL